MSIRLIALLAFLGFAACENPSIGIGATINSNGVSVSPTATGNVGGARVTVSG